MPNNSVYISGAEEYYGIPSGLYASIINAIGNKANGVNVSGGYGIAGITPKIASDYGGNRYDVNQNIIIGILSSFLIIAKVLTDGGPE